MERKKSNKANLENKKGIFVQIGLVVTLALVLISFEWTTLPNLDKDLDMVAKIDIEEQMLITRRPEPPKEEIKPKLPPVAQALDIVEDDIEVPDVVFKTEVDDDTNISYAFPDDDDDVVDEPEQVFIIVEDMPTFNGGDPEIEFRKYIGKNLEYPRTPAENGIAGRVQVQFTVNSKGEVVDAKVTKGVDPYLDKEAIRVITSSPLWSPGKQRGKPVSVLFSFPINFVLQ